MVYYVPTFGNTKLLLLLLLLVLVLVFRAKNDGYDLSFAAPLPLDVLIVLYSCIFGYFEPPSKLPRVEVDPGD